MTDERKHLYVSYSRGDAHLVRQFLQQLTFALKQHNTPVDIWFDQQALMPGTDWEKSIEQAIRTSVGVLFFVSPASARSERVAREVEAAIDQQRLILPIALGDVSSLGDVPSVLRELKFIQIQIPPTHVQMAEAAVHAADAIDSGLRQHPQTPPPLVAPVAKKFAEEAAEDAAEEAAEEAAENVRAAISRPTEDDQAPPESVFVVHGHDEDALRDVCNALSEFGVRQVVLSQTQGPAQSLLQKFFSASKEARFAIVILTSDDYGASRVQYEAEGVADRALQYRARQNVILELGFFYGYLGWENVFVLLKKPSKVFPNFERPSDLDGAVFDPIDEGAQWKTILAEKLRDAGFHCAKLPRNNGLD
jgi:predicted nucleotide-binding protein